MKDSILVGTFELKRPTEIRINTETASRYWDIVVPPGRYDAYMSKDEYTTNMLQTAFVYVPVSGECIRSRNESRLFDAVIDHSNEDIGKTMSTNIPYFVYQVRNNIRFEPTEEFRSFSHRD